MIKDINGRFKKPIVNEKRSGRKSDAISNLNKRTRDRTSNDLEDWSVAVNIAERRDRPDRTRLMELYKNMEIDGHVMGILTTLKNKIKAKDFWLVDSEGEPDDEAKKIFESKWFFKYLDWSIESWFYGFSLIQLNAMVDGQFKDMELVPREFVIPDLDIVKYDIATFSEGDPHLNYKDRANEKWFMFIGEKTDLGLFNNIAPQVISKKHILSAMWQFIEIFGQPMRIGKTDMEDNNQKERMVSMMETMGRSSWAVIDLEGDEIEFTESIKGDVEVFLGAIGLANQEASKGLTGVSGMFDEKSFVGSAEVQERILKELMLSYQRSTEFNTNDDLIPKMQAEGNFPDRRFMWRADDLLSIGEKVEAIVKLSQFYKIPEDEVTSATGLEIEEKVEPEPIKPIKEKSASARTAEIYNTFNL